MKVYSLKNKKYALYSVLATFLLWLIAAQIVHHPIKIPSPILVAKEFFSICTSQTFVNMLIHSIIRVWIGFLLAVVIGLILGVCASLWQPIYYLLSSIVSILRAMPTMGFILLSLIWLTREFAPMLTVILIIFPIIYSSVVSSIMGIDKNLLEMARVYCLSKREQIVHLYLPAILPGIGVIISGAIGLAMKVGIAAEVLAQPRYAIGTGLQMEKTSLNTAGVLAWCVVVIVFSATFEWMVKKFFEKINRRRNIDSRINRAGD